MIEWLIDDDNRELEDEIEAVNSRMLDKLLDSSPFITVFFCKQKFVSIFYVLGGQNLDFHSVFRRRGLH